MSFANVILELLMSSSYFLIGAVIGSTARKRPLLSALVPALLLRGSEVVLQVFIAVESRGSRMYEFYLSFLRWRLHWFAIFLVASLLGASFGVAIRKVSIARRTRESADV